MTENATKCIHDMPVTKVECDFSPSHWVKDNRTPTQVIEDFLQTMQECSTKLSRTPIDSQLDIMYNKNPVCKGLDIYGASILIKQAPVFSFVHGGYWVSGDKALSKSMVETLVNRGIIVALVGYTLAPGATLHEMIDEVRDAIEYLGKWAEFRGSSGLYLAGHSAGAHLVFMALQRTRRDTILCLKGVMLLSGIYDMDHVLHLEDNMKIRLQKQDVERLSPIHNCQKFLDLRTNVKLYIICAEYDSPGFLKMSRDFWQAVLRAKTKYQEQDKPANKSSVSALNITYRILDQSDHFSMITDLRVAQSELVQIICRDFISTVNYS